MKLNRVSIGFLFAAHFLGRVEKSRKRSWHRSWRIIAYRHEKKNTSHVKIGRNGKKNWLVTGIRRAAMRSATAPVFSNGLGDGLIDSANIPSEIKNRY
jgi:hypothetical protein